MALDMSFSILKPGNARLGLLHLKNRVLETPNYIAPTSRGAVIHCTPDVLDDIKNVPGVLIAFEDCESNSFNH